MIPTFKASPQFWLYLDSRPVLYRPLRNNYQIIRFMPHMWCKYTGCETWLCLILLVSSPQILNFTNVSLWLWCMLPRSVAYHHTAWWQMRKKCVELWSQTTWWLQEKHLLGPGEVPGSIPDVGRAEDFEHVALRLIVNMGWEVNLYTTRLICELSFVMLSIVELHQTIRWLWPAE